LAVGQNTESITEKLLIPMIPISLGTQISEENIETAAEEGIRL
jgi:hypothetical protein